MNSKPPHHAAKAPKRSQTAIAHEPAFQWKSLVNPLIFSVLFAGLALVINHTSIGEEFELFTYRILQRQLEPPEHLPVTVIDISELRPAEGGATPREPLRKLLEALSNMGGSDAPKVIGVDIDFSPEVDANGNLQKFIDHGDPDFFSFCSQNLSGNEPSKDHILVPTFLGVFRTQGLSPERWLGFSQFKDLGASLWLPEKEGVAIPSVYPTNGHTMSSALADAYTGHNLSSQPKDSIGSYFFPVYTTEQIAPGLQLRESWIDYSIVERLRWERVVLRRKAYDDPEELRDDLKLRKEDIRGQMVLLGDLQGAQYGDDVFTDPAHGGPVPGVLIHAAAAFTQAKRPLHAIHPWIRPLLDFLFALLSLSIQAVLIARLGERLEPEKAKLVVTIVLVLGILLFGLLINQTHVLWDDFLFVAILTAIHPACHHAFDRMQTSLWRWLLTRREVEAE